MVAAGLIGHVTEWTGCGGTRLSYREVVLDGRVYVQIKQIDSLDLTDQVLGTLRLGRG